MSTTRRIGTETSQTRTALLDATERLMLEEGYAAVTSRRVAARAGLKPQLVHYYFRTWDDLFLAAYRRRAEQGLERLDQALEAPQPLWAMWDLSRDPRRTALTMEFVALANHRKPIRAEIAASAERYRAAVRAGVDTVLERYGVDRRRYPAIVCTVMMMGVAQILVIEEESLGMATGHGETVAFVEQRLTEIEGSRQAAADALASA